MRWLGLQIESLDLMKGGHVVESTIMEQAQTKN